MTKLKGGYNWELPPQPVAEIRNNDLRLVDLTVKVIFKWSDELETVDECGNVEFHSGWVMHIPAHTQIYGNQPTTFLASSLQEE